jgi:hypothetical protein
MSQRTNRAHFALDILADLAGVSPVDLADSGLTGRAADPDFLERLPAAIEPSHWIEFAGERVPVWNSRPGEPPDLLSSTFYQVSLSADWSRPASSIDPHGRQLAIDSQRQRLGILEQPTVNHYGSWLRERLGGASRSRRAFLSHDIDNVSARTRYVLGADTMRAMHLLRGRRVRPALQGVLRMAANLVDDEGDQLAGVIEDERNRGACSTFFVLAGERSRFGARYRIDDEQLSASLRGVIDAGSEVGLHANYHAFGDPHRLMAERRAIETVIGHSVTSSRHHYLRVIPRHWSLLERVGIKVDGSLGYADAWGYRGGIAWPFRFYDFARNRATELVLVPLTYMDKHLLTFVAPDVERAAATVTAEMNRIATLGGAVSVLWHSETRSARNYPDWWTVYLDAIDTARRLGFEFELHSGLEKAHPDLAAAAD